MSFLRVLRKLVLGETWSLPLAIAVAIGLAAVARAFSDGAAWWHEAGGLLLTVLLLAALGWSVRVPRR